jgi:putative transposase
MRFQLNGMPFIQPLARFGFSIGTTNIIPIFDYPMDIRKAMYTTNAIEALNRSWRKVIKTKAVFSDEESVFKLLYLAMNNIAKRWNRPIKDWRAALSHFAILFPGLFNY